MAALDDILQGDLQPGLYRLTTEVNLDSFSLQLQDRGWKWFYFEGEQITNKSEFLREFAAVMHFPPYFGYNWDAFEECITDPRVISVTKFILFYNQPEKFAQNEPSQWSVAIHLLQIAVNYWNGKNVLLYVLFKTTHSTLDSLETL